MCEITLHLGWHSAMANTLPVHSSDRIHRGLCCIDCLVYLSSPSTETQYNRWRRARETRASSPHPLENWRRRRIKPRLTRVRLGLVEVEVCAVCGGEVGRNTARLASESILRTPVGSTVPVMPFPHAVAQSLCCSSAPHPSCLCRRCALHRSTALQRAVLLAATSCGHSGHVKCRGLTPA